MHEYHHIAVKCNYGIVGLLDRVCGTSGEYDDFERAKMLETTKKIE
jgi:sterol desaturase/sphingolipid hydroxylase (fatty acid hydroxylase superfamily)